jgi:hypothetical protein
VKIKPSIASYITKKSLDKIVRLTNNKQYFVSKDFEKEIIKEMLDILKNDRKFQDFSEQCMTDILLKD